MAPPPPRALWSGVRMVASARACSSQIRRSHPRARHGSGTSLYLRHVIYPPPGQTKFFCNRCGSPSTLADDAAVGRTGIFPVGSPATWGTAPPDGHPPSPHRPGGIRECLRERKFNVGSGGSPRRSGISCQPLPCPAHGPGQGEAGDGQERESVLALE